MFLMNINYLPIFLKRTFIAFIGFFLHGYAKKMARTTQPDISTSTRSLHYLIVGQGLADK